MTGEEMHETCQYGVFAQAAFRIHPLTGDEEGFAMPLCGWKPEKCPPALSRCWGGQIRSTEDCSGCQVYEPL